MAKKQKKKDYRTSPFKVMIRLRPEQLKKLKKYKTTITLAGYLDIILNAHWASMETHKYEHFLIEQKDDTNNKK